MIEVRGLYKSFGKVEVLHNINATFKKGKVNQVIGKSGSGKSVLAKCIVGLLPPDKGEVLYNGESFQGMSKERRKELRQEIGMLFQGSALFDSLTVLENVMFPLRMFATMNERQMRERADFCLKRVKIEGADAKYPAEISGGMQKRVGIARAIVAEPRLLVADEPTGNLDPTLAAEIMSLFASMPERGTSVLVASHDLSLLKRMKKRVLILDHGKLVDDISPADLAE